MIQRDEDFRDLGAGYFDPFDRQKLARHLIRRLHELGLDVEVQILIVDLDERGFRLIGEGGEGPGEFSGWVLLAPFASGYVTADRRAGRVSWFDGKGHLQGDVSVPGRIMSLQVDDEGRAWLGGLFTDGHTVLRIGVAPNRAMNMGGGVLTGSPRMDPMVLAPPLGHHIWAFRMGGGLIEVLDANTLETLDVVKLPFADYHRPAPMRMDLSKERPPAVVDRAVLSGDGLMLYLYSMVPDSDWEIGLEEMDEIWDTEVLIIEAGSRSVIGRVRFDGFCQPVEAELAACVDLDMGGMSFHRIERR